MSHSNGIRAADLGPVTWRRSAAATAGAENVEFAVLDDGQVAVRNARDPEGPVLVYTPAEISAFVDGAKKGEFDDMVERRTSD
ncbi:protein of unknown function [Pseudonocardia ammonioxydans]|uniref:DUF397 domain-containing protein n=1 Tax=Pseudonocardia ammonioxydans TaxID=260086 RepID=A0A1I4V7C9_PSUAM|nr:DUF397 domain-containing protein [Pseudonocardia ammonioxydans]SFM97116.1 protein of unknown function [Pseudonocardia ammonioxydans]